LVTIAKLSALGVSGVSRMAPVAGGVNRLFRRGAGEGVRIEISDDTVSVDLYLVLDHGTNVRDVSRNVQAEVASAIETMVGMSVSRVDVHIEDFDELPAGE
jgi:uncharacterized alkaline shock family protein YloU